MLIVDRLRRLCQSRAAWDVPPQARSTTDPRVQATLAELLALKELIAQELLPDYFLTFTIEVSVGRGKPVKVPWLVILGPGQRVQEGFYIALSVEPTGRGLVLGIMKSATHPPEVLLTTHKRTPLPPDALDVDSPTYRFNDAFHNPQEFFTETIDEEAFLNHLRTSLERYQELLTEDQPEPIYRRKGRKPSPAKSASVREAAPPVYRVAQDLTGIVPAFQADCAAAGLSYAPALLTRFIAALLAKPFVILSGLSGSGKTKLAQALAHWLELPYALVAVGADWTSRDPILGYPDALDPARYVRTPALELLLAATAAPETLHLLILDELNLSPVERYFADLLSSMESGEPLALHTELVPREGVPARLPWPPNLVVIGTVNADETTHAFSPKVLDRASVLAFGSESLAAFLDSPRSVSLERLAGRGSTFAPLLLQALHDELPLPERPRVVEALVVLHETLTAHDVAFGFRTARELLRFIGAYGALSGSDEPNSALDAAVCQKLLPRLHGSQRRLTPVLEALGALATNWPLTTHALRRMRTRLEHEGFVSFFEA